VRPVPPFTEAHEALRGEIRAFVEGELRPVYAETCVMPRNPRDRGGDGGDRRETSA
jgi:hypothetical protein